MTTTKSISSVVAKIMQIQEHTMNKEKITTKTPQHLKLDLKTFEEPQLKTMLEVSEAWITAIDNMDYPYWCSLLGAAGTWKTHLAKACRQKITDYTLDLYKDKKVEIKDTQWVLSIGLKLCEE